MVNYIIVTGGVISGLGKGITTASIGKILQIHGYKVTAIKIDPYINCDAGTLRPTEHGEVWVTEDGGEIDQDLGHYERFLDIDILKYHNITTGQVYGAVIEKERKGKYLGKTVQPIPHVTDEIKRRIRMPAKETKYDFVIVEIGGTVGDYENVLFLEAVRQMKYEGDLPESILETIGEKAAWLHLKGYILLLASRNETIGYSLNTLNEVFNESGQEFPSFAASLRIENTISVSQITKEMIEKGMLDPEISKTEAISFLSNLGGTLRKLEDTPVDRFYLHDLFGKSTFRHSQRFKKAKPNLAYIVVDEKICKDRLSL